MANSWKPEVVADASGKWYPNGLAFRTREEAELSATSNYARWMAVTDYRAVESDEVPNYQIVDGVMSAIK